MQTFLPYESFSMSAKALDNKRLGKQRVECLQILKALTQPEYGWKNHPATKMWRGFEYKLLEYGLSICDEWTARGFKDSCRDKMINIMNEVPFYDKTPFWLGNEQLHASHRSNLLRKHPDWYGKFDWSEKDNIEYFWPV